MFYFIYYRHPIDCLLVYFKTCKKKKNQKHNEKNRDWEKLTLEQKCKLRRAQNKSTTQVLSNT